RGLLKSVPLFGKLFTRWFILSPMDPATGVPRFMGGKFVERSHPPFERPDWLPGALLTSVLVVTGWAYFILTGSISTIWPMFGIANQLLAAIALCVGTSVIINEGRARYAWVTIVPMVFVATTTLTAGWESIFNIFLKDAQSPDHALRGYLDTALTAIMMTCVLIVLVDSVLRWRKALTKATRPAVAPAGD